MNIIHKIPSILFVLPAALLGGCSDGDGQYLVRETDTIDFSSCLASSKSITLRCNGSWRTVIPEGAEWLSTEPAEGIGDGSFAWIAVKAAHNRSAARTATIYLENDGRQYPITVSQADGSILYGAPYVDGNLIEAESSTARLCFTYANAYGDETIEVECSPSGDCDGLTVAGARFELANGGAVLALDIAGTPTRPGYADFEITVDGVAIGQARAKVYSQSEMPIEGFPVQWVFSAVRGSTDDVNALKARQPDWTTDLHLLRSDTGSAVMKLVESAGKTAGAISGWAYNDGHIYVKGIYYNDSWQLEIPVKYLTAGTIVNCSGSFGGSGSSAGFYLIEYSADGAAWQQAGGAKTETFNNTPVTYHARAYDSYSAGDGYFSCDFPVQTDIAAGTLYIRYRVSANVRVTANNTITTGGGGSSRLKGTFSVSVVDENLNR